MLKGYIHAAVNAENDRGPADDSEPVGHIVLMLKRSDAQQKELDALVDQLHNVRSEKYHQWLTPAEFGDRFSPADGDVAAVSEWLESEGFRIEDIPPSKTHITFTGTVGQMRRAFQVDIHKLIVNGEAHEATVTEPQIPTALVPVIAGFRQLHNFWPTPDVVDEGVFRTDMRTGKSTRVKGPLGGVRADATFSYNGDTYYEVGPQDFYTIYNEKPLLSAGINGAGVTIAVIEETQIVEADVASFRSVFGLPAYPATPNSTEGGVNFIYGTAGGVGGDGACIAPLAASPGNGNQSEASLDVEWAGATAPKATIDFVACGKSGTGIGSPGIDIAAEHVVNYLSKTVSASSLSYGSCETNLGATGEAYYSNLWEQFAAEGITAVVSSGDSGPDRCDQGQTAAGNAPSVNGLASSAYNVVAGGTDFSDTYISNFYATSPATTWWSGTNGPGDSSAKSYIPERAWGSHCTDPLYDSFLEFNKNTDYGTTYTPQGVCFGAAEAGAGNLISVKGGGGGSSVDNAKPTWQSVYGVGKYSSSTTFRNLPDISFFAASGFWGHVLEYCDSDNASCAFMAGTDEFQSSGAGGTSFVAPQVAGLMALIDQKTGDRQGQADYTIYNLAVQEYGTPAKPNTSKLSACSGSARGADVAKTCIFHDIAGDTPSLQGGTIASATLEPCYTDGVPDCYAVSGDPFGVSSVPGASATTLAYYAGTGYDLTTGLGSLNIDELVENWNTVTPTFTSTTTLGPTSGTVSHSTAVKLTAVVKAEERGGTVAPAGIVEFFEGSTSGVLVGKAPIVSSCSGSGSETSCEGRATLSVSAADLHAGSNSVIAYFEGDGANDGPSMSKAVTIADSNTAQTITFTGLPVTATYGAAGPYTLKATGGASGNAVTFSVVSGPAKVSGDKLTITGAGTVVVAANQLGNSTYAAAAEVTHTITVAKAKLTVSANNLSRVVGAANPKFTFAYSGFIKGDTAEDSLTGEPSATTTATTSSPAGTYPIKVTQGTLAAKNYEFTFKNGVLTVTAK
jgi:subtilase family serine protease